MDPVSAMIAAAGLALTIYGTVEKSKGANAQEAVQEQEVRTEFQQDQLRNQIMNLTSQREQYQNLRNVQRARSLATANAATSGAMFGSGLQGGLGQVSGQGGQNQLKISQDTMAGNEMFALNQQLSGEKLRYAQAGGTINFGTGLMAVGSGIMGSQKQLTDLTNYGYGQFESNVLNSGGASG